jgi:hypothetical protein
MIPCFKFRSIRDFSAENLDRDLKLGKKKVMTDWAT